MNRLPSVLGVFSVLELQVETVSRFMTNAHKLSNLLQVDGCSLNLTSRKILLENALYVARGK
jgi:hypothetical protein